jgi:GNAT superfamily N-acetyltransferase
MRIKLQPATVDDVPDLVSLRTAVSEYLALQFPGVFQPSGITEKGIRFAMTRATLYVARFRSQPIAAFTLSTRKPWAIDAAFFSPTPIPLYLTDMAVHPRRQHQGIGGQCLAQAIEFAKQWPATAIRLDAYDAEYGAGEFYRKCGFREVGRALYRQIPLIYFESLVAPPEPITSTRTPIERAARRQP